MSEECPNPLLLEWLKEWWTTARENGHKGALTYKKAYESMRACPLKFTHPSEALQLHGLGPKLCERLTQNLKLHCEENGLPAPEEPRKARKRPSSEALAEEAPAKKPRKTKAYVPALRSGAYAIIVALSTVSEDSGSGLTKAETIEAGQEHSDSSFTAPSDPTKFYTAWNSMKTLESKDLVYTMGRPTKRYCLTEEGWEVAKRVRNANSLGKGGAKDLVLPAEPGQARLEAVQSIAASVPRLPATTNVIDLQPGETNNPIPKLVERSDFELPKALYGTKSTIVDLESEDDDGPDLPDAPRKFATIPPTEFLSLSSSPPCKLPQPAPGKRTDGLLQKRPDQSDAFPNSNTHTRGNDTPLEPPPRIAQLPHGEFTTQSFKPIRIPVDSYTIELIIDNREVRSKTDHKYIQDELIKHDIDPTTRGLPLGDAVWVARLKPGFVHHLTSNGEEGTEILLSHIVERKRLDDLLGSIKDGRFHEQKFRLKRSGVPNVTYLIEDINLGADGLTKAYDSINSAIAGTMVVSGFFVKRTRKLDDTIAYLARMTKLLRKKFEGKGLDVVPSSALEDERGDSGRKAVDIADVLKGGNQFITFASFAALAGKNDSLTLRDVFLKMLMCTRGITGDKAMEIQRQYKTPNAFVEALEREGEGIEAEGDRRRQDMVFKAAGQLVGRRKIGKALSAKVGDVWGQA